MTSTIAQLKALYRDGSLSKPDFIREALKVHQTLFQYVDVIRTTDIREILIDANSVVFVVGEEGIRLQCPPNEARVAPVEVMNFDHYEIHETRVMDTVAQDCRNLVDIGANIGMHTVRFAMRAPQARVFAFEPMPGSFAFLQRNVAENGVGDRVSCFNYGLSDRNGTIDFFIAPTAGTNASLMNVADAQDAQRIVGLTLTLDQWATNQAIAPDFIKCDVEGAELLVFRGGHSTLARHRPVVFTELLRKWSRPFGYHPNDVIEFFASFGYECMAVGETGVRRLTCVTDETIETNYVFLHREAHAEKISRLVSKA
ncbi:FkbM family methyltransferase [Paraburkholderia bannensis]|uniref:FkbM family methyltransferase n=1 Tax=Paraburkholderia bannensis TaxID=765414 RepID=A0A7W9TT50_9BURK|nr:MULTISPECIES: FkbM family methyltransferase [Paraburkholderia]MBB3255882.1 FkbM family methyltransferase [Paraburkholderia sp. WP4_3_2]MBB6100882.1 FkbM family methyltransferase [Paraburkholderia bannensis]